VIQGFGSVGKRSEKRGVSQEKRRAAPAGKKRKGLTARKCPKTKTVGKRKKKKVYQELKGGGAGASAREKSNSEYPDCKR